MRGVNAASRRKPGGRLGEVATVDQSSDADPVHTERLRTAIISTFMVACVGLNVFGNAIVGKFDLMLFLDMAGTAAAAFVLGPRYAVVVALVTSVTTSVSGSPESIAFAVVGVAGALCWGYGYHRFRIATTALRFFMLNVVTAAICTLVSLPVTVLVFGGAVDHASSVTTATIQGIAHSFVIAFFASNLLSSIIDTLIAGYLGLLTTRLLAPLSLGPSGESKARSDATSLRA